MVQVIHADCLDAMRAMAVDSIDSIVTDPPYGLSFMGAAWDHGVPGVPFWAEALRVAKPGAYLVAFGGTRTYHRLACAIEDAGWEVRDCLSWLYGSGFPKSLNVGKAVDNLAPPSRDLSPEEARFCAWVRDSSGLTREALRSATGSDRFWTGEVEILNTATAERPRLGRRAMVPTAEVWGVVRGLLATSPPAWVEALVKDPPKPGISHPSEWKGGAGEGTAGDGPWAGWGTALKPAWEPAIVARKPLIGTVAENVTAHGTGGINVDACRIGMSEQDRAAARVPQPTYGVADGVTGFGAGEGRNGATFEPAAGGRWPANVLLDEEAAAALDAQSGISKPKPARTGPKGGNGGALGAFSGSTADAIGHWPEDPGGGASRFFYCAKASKSERGAGNTHPTVKPLALMRWIVRLVTPPGGIVLDPFAGSGTTGLACDAEGFRSVLVEREEAHVEIIRSRLAAPRERARRPVQRRAAKVVTVARSSGPLFGEAW